MPDIVSPGIVGSRPGRRLPEWAVVLAAAVLLAVVMTWPIAPRMNRAARIDSTDAMYAMWNVAWVARALTSDPLNVFNANIFHPHSGTLAFSESNLLTGALGIPAWLLTANVYATYNSVVLIGFTLSYICAYALMRRLTGSRVAAAIGALGFAYCPYVYARFPHIQLQMTFGLPLSLLALHRLADAPSWQRGTLLGLALAAQGLTCAYYGILAGLSVGLGVLFLACTRRLWISREYWLAVAIALLVCLAIIVPLFLPYIAIQEAGFQRALDDARVHSFGWRSWLASPARLHTWMLPWLRESGWRGGVLFPGFITSIAGLAGLGLAAAGARRLPARARETGWLYTAFGVLAFWLSLGPAAGLFTLAYYTVPAFTFLRAPERFGIPVSLALAVGSAFAIVWLRSWVRARTTALATGVLTAAFAAAAIADSWIAPLYYPDALQVPSVYRALARSPRGAVAEFPFFYRRIDYNRHGYYMLMSTYHWQPLINGYSDHYPEPFVDMLDEIKDFPTDPRSFTHLRERNARYVVMHIDWYEHRRRPVIEQALKHYVSTGVLKFVNADAAVGARGQVLYDVALYEILTYPD